VHVRHLEDAEGEDRRAERYPRPACPRKTPGERRGGSHGDEHWQRSDTEGRHGHRPTRA
jgi:hypothetical protein